MAKLRVTLVGIGGYGAMYCSALKDSRLSDCQLVAAVDPNAAASADLSFLRERKVRILPSISGLADVAPADLAIVTSPSQFHAEHTIELLSMGSHVLCEKPLCASLEQASCMAVARDRASRHLGIGYQWSYSEAIQSLKADILAGRLGKPRRLRTLVLWPRDEMYYRRNKWAGRCVDDSGRPVYDSPVNNAAAHFLHNMLYVLGDATDRSAVPACVTAELYRVHTIENYDTAALRCVLSGDVEILLIASHAVSESHGPCFEYEFDNAVVRYEMRRGAHIVAHFADGRTRNYGSPEESHYQKLFAMLKTVRTGQTPVCGIEAAVPQTQVMLAAQRSSEVQPFALERVCWTGVEGSRSVQVEGLDADLLAYYKAGRLPCEMALNWAVAGREIRIDPWPLKSEIHHLNGRPVSALATLRS
jgi:predicted dehydrogenase